MPPEERIETSCACCLRCGHSRASNAARRANKKVTAYRSVAAGPKSRHPMPPEERIETRTGSGVNTTSMRRHPMPPEERIETAVAAVPAHSALRSASNAARRANRNPTIPLQVDSPQSASNAARRANRNLVHHEEVKSERSASNAAEERIETLEIETEATFSCYVGIQCRPKSE